MANIPIVIATQHKTEPPFPVNVCRVKYISSLRTSFTNSNLNRTHTLRPTPNRKTTRPPPPRRGKLRPTCVLLLLPAYLRGSAHLTQFRSMYVFSLSPTTHKTPASQHLPQIASCRHASLYLHTTLALCLSSSLFLSLSASFALTDAACTIRAHQTTAFTHMSTTVYLYMMVDKVKAVIQRKTYARHMCTCKCVFVWALDFMDERRRGAREASRGSRILPSEKTGSCEEPASVAASSLAPDSPS